VQGGTTADNIKRLRRSRRRRRTELERAGQTRWRRRFQTAGPAQVGRRATGGAGVDDPATELQFGTVEAVQVEIVGQRRTATRYHRRQWQAPGTASADGCGPAEGRRPTGSVGDSGAGRTRQRGVRAGQTAPRRVMRITAAAHLRGIASGRMIPDPQIPLHQCEPKLKYYPHHSPFIPIPSTP